MSNMENEQMYLDMVNQLKLKYEEITSKLESIERKDKEIKKDFITTYGIARLLDQLVASSVVGFDDELVIVVEILRSFLSDSMDRHIFN